MKLLFKLRFTMGVLIICFTLVASAAVWTAKEHKTSDELRIENKTRSLLIESVSETEKQDTKIKTDLEKRRFKVVVRNGYNKAIVAYSLRQIDSSVLKGDVSGVEIDGATGGWILSPNETHTTYMFFASRGEATLIVSAALFEDNDGDGNLEDLARLRGFRAGIKTQFQQIVSILRQTVNSNKSVSPDAAIQLLKTEIEAIQEEDKTFSPGLRSGLHHGKEFVINDLKQLEDRMRLDQNLQYRLELAKILTQIEEALTKLR
jgi:hypothetical protein